MLNLTLIASLVPIITAKPTNDNHTMKYAENSTDINKKTTAPIEPAESTAVLNKAKANETIPGFNASLTMPFPITIRRSQTCTSTVDVTPETETPVVDGGLGLPDRNRFADNDDLLPEATTMTS